MDGKGSTWCKARRPCCWCCRQQFDDARPDGHWQPSGRGQGLEFISRPVSLATHPPNQTPEGQPPRWSQRFDDALHPFIARFNASIGFDFTLLQQDLDGSIAHGRMLAACGVITMTEAQQIVEGLETIAREAADGTFRPVRNWDLIRHQAPTACPARARATCRANASRSP